MQEKSYIIRTMDRGEVDLAVEWAAQEGWNPGLHDADSFYLADPNGFLVGSETIYLDAPEVNVSAVELAEKYNMKVVFETARMYTEEKPDISLDRLFGVTSFELG